MVTHSHTQKKTSKNNLTLHSKNYKKKRLSLKLAKRKEIIKMRAEISRE